MDPLIVALPKGKTGCNSQRDKEQLSKLQLKPISMNSADSRGSQSADAILHELKAFSQLAKYNDAARNRCIQLLQTSFNQLANSKGEMEKENNLDRLETRKMYQASYQGLQCLWQLTLNHKRPNQRLLQDTVSRHLSFIEILHDIGYHKEALDGISTVFQVISSLIYSKNIDHDNKAFSKSPLSPKQLLKGLEFRHLSQNSTLLELVSQLNIASLKWLSKSLICNGTKSADENLITPQNFVKCISPGSNFYYWFKSFPPNISLEFSLHMIEIMKALGSLNTTVFKLVYQMKELEYSIFTGTHDEVLNRTIALFSLMIKKNESVVFQYTSSVFFHICELWSSHNMPFSKLNTLLTFYDRLSKDKNIKLQWNNFYTSEENNSIVVHLQDLSLDNMRINSEILTDCVEFHLCSEMEFCNMIVKIIDSLQFDEESKQMLVSIGLFYNTSLQKFDGPSLYKFQLDVLDSLARKLKEVNVLEGCNVILTLTNHLFEVLKKFKYILRIRNLSNILFHMGNTLAELAQGESFTLWKLCLHFELEITSLDSTDKNIFKNFNAKCSRIINNLIDKKLFQEAFELFPIVFDQQLSKCAQKDIFDVQHIVRSNFMIYLKLATRLVIQSSCGINILAITSNDVITVLVLIELISMLIRSSVLIKDKLCSKIVLDVYKNCENGLFLFFVGQISTVMNINSSVFGFSLLEVTKDDSFDCPALQKYKELVFCHIRLLKLCMSSDINQGVLKSLFTDVFDFSRSSLNKLDHIVGYEFMVIEMFIDFFSYSLLDAYSLVLLEHYRSTRQDQLNIDQLTILMTKEIDLLLNLKSYSKASLVLQSKFFATQSFHNIHLMLPQLRYNVEIRNFAKATSLLNLMKEICETNEKLKLQNVCNKEEATTLLFLHEHMCVLSGELYFLQGDYIESILELKKSLRIVQTVMPFLALSFQGQTSALSLSFRSILPAQIAYELLKIYGMLQENMRRVGNLKEFTYYGSEFSKMMSVQKIPYVSASSCFHLAECAIMSEKLEDANSYLSKGVQLQNESEFSNKLLDLQNLSTNEFFYQMVGNFEVMDQFRDKYDSVVDNLLTSPSTDVTSNVDTLAERKYHYDLEGLRNGIGHDILQIKSRRVSSIANGRVVDSDKTNKSFDELPLTAFIKSKKMLDNGRKLLLTDPVFLNLQDSAIYMNSVEYSGTQQSERQVLPSVEKALASFKTCETDISSEILLPRYMKRELNSTLLSSKYFISAISSAEEILPETVMLDEDRIRSQPFDDEKRIAMEKNDCKSSLPLAQTEGKVSKQVSFGDELFYSLAELIPSNWMVISVDVCPITGDLLLCRYNTLRQEKVVFFRLPLNRHNSRDVDQQLFSFQDSIREMQDIILGSNRTISVERTSIIKTKEDRAVWWRERKELDKRLEELLDNMQNYWFGGFKGIFSNTVFSSDVVKQFKDAFMMLLENFLPSRQKNVKRKAGSIVNVELKDSIFELFLSLNSDNERADALEDLVFFVLDCLQYHGETNAYDEIDFEQLLTELREMLKSFSTVKLNNSSQIEHFVLILSGQAVTLPWESIPLLRSKSVSRVPSFHMLESLLKRRNEMNSEIDTSSGYYIINPGGDLLKTEGNFKDKFNQMQNWDGLVRERPKEEDIVNALHEKNLYVYIGHGGGEAYVRANSIKTINNCAPVLLIGCSSGSLKVNGFFDPYGTVYNYLIAGSPMVLCNLWDVTDKDIDRFTVSVFKKWGLFVDYDSFDLDDLNDGQEGEQAPSMASVIPESRDTCVLKYINGAAPVLYGVPFKVK